MVILLLLEMLTLLIKHNIFRQSELVRDIALQNTHFVLLKLPVVCKSVCFVHKWGADYSFSWLVSIRNIRSLQPSLEWKVATNSRLITFLWKHWINSLETVCFRPGNTFRIFEWWTHKSSTLQKFHWFSANAKTFFFSLAPKEFIKLLLKYIVNLLKRNMQSIKRRHVTNFRNKVWLLIPKTITCKQWKVVLASVKNLQLKKRFTASIINPSSSYGTVFLRTCFVCSRATTRVWIHTLF